jgi:hypothetical protein
LEANPILPAGKYEAFSSVFNERFSRAPGATNYNGKGVGVLPKLNTTLTPGNTRYGRLTVTYGNSWRFGGRGQVNDNIPQDRSPSNDSKELSAEGSPSPPDFVLPDELENFLVTTPHEFQYLMKKSCKLMYLRLNNSRLNYFSKSGRRYYSSIFFDCKALLNERAAKKPLDLYAYFH